MSNLPPYQPPQPIGPGNMAYPPTKKTPNEDVRTVAAGQRMLLRGFLLMVVANIVIMAFSGGPFEPEPAANADVDVVSLVALLAGLLFALTGLVVCIWGVAKMGSVLFSAFETVCYCIGFFLPCISLIVLLVISSKATKYLKKHGIKVGLMGASKSQFQ